MRETSNHDSRLKLQPRDTRAHTTPDSLPQCPDRLTGIGVPRGIKGAQTRDVAQGDVCDGHQWVRGTHAVGAVWVQHVAA